ncbi:MAG: SPOR domain-containing protein [Rhodobacteraceae bacterium]|nr:SPOR domain-containing protein [Paracoccaceae bacterium]
MVQSQKIQTESVQKPVKGAGLVRMAMNWSIAGASIAVLVGFGYWAVSLGTRNPNEVPIILAMEGPARVQPDNPGGEQASHQGLAVNSVQADGGVADPSQTVALAPPPEPLREEDVAGGNLVAAHKASDETQADLVTAATSADQPMPEPVAETPVRRAIAGTRFSPTVSLRPLNRPAGLAIQLANIQPAIAGPSASLSVDSVPLGTRLVQLGAYDSSVMAIKQWEKLFARHGDLLEDKKRLVQPAESGGRKFFRLRAAGFASKDDSRTLCSALLARGTPCIPVTAR